jgi:endo-1,4-beta-xylanase
MFPTVDGSEITDVQLMKSSCTEFNMLTSGNALKWDVVHPAPNKWNWVPGERMYAVAKACGMRFIGGPPVWKWQIPRWVSAFDGRPDELRAILQDHVKTLVRHFAGRIQVWDVVNEALDFWGSLTNDLWSRNLGPGYVADAFKWAHQADPLAKLYYNDFASDGFGAKGNGVFNQVQSWLSQGAPIDGVGFQAHGILESRSKDRLIENLRRYARLGLETRMSEIAIPIGPRTAKDQTQQAAKFGMLASACFAPGTGCRMFTVWGTSDRDYTPVAAWKGTCCGVLLDGTFQRKPAYFAVQRALDQAA